MQTTQQPHDETGRPADADAGNWVDRYTPPVMRPYLRLMRADRPIGVWLLVIPCWWGAALALAAGHGDWRMFFWHGLLFTIGSIAMRGAGCAYNDIVDRDFDAEVARTKMRPIPSGQISVRAAWAFLVALSLTGLIVLLQFNSFTILLGLASLALVAAYPFMKRITWWPQAWLGLTFNWGALVGYAAAAGGLSTPAVLLYAGGVFWTLGYDTIYAHQDKEDDALIGVKSSARALGSKSRGAIRIFYVITISCFGQVGLMANLPLIYFVALFPAALHFTWQYSRLDIDDGAICLKLFKSNREAGLLLLAPLLLAAAFSGS